AAEPLSFRKAEKSLLAICGSTASFGRIRRNISSATAQRVQPGTVAARLTSRHFGCRVGSRNLSQLVKRRSTNRSVRRYRSFLFDQLKTASTAGTAIVQREERRCQSWRCV